MKQVELKDLNHCMLFVNTSYHKPQLKVAGGGSLVAQKTLNMAFWICGCTVALNKFKTVIIKCLV